jgi:type IV secretory pathway VirB2 component (pilin)
MLLYIVYLCYAIAGIVAVIASLQIYIKMNVGEEGIKKEIMMVIGAILFIISASIVMPALFGYQL